MKTDEQRHLQKQNNTQSWSSDSPTVFISYNWNDGSDIADRIEKTLEGIAKVHRDKKNLKSGDSILVFMNSIRKQDFVILVISDQYLKSAACLFEVVQLMKDEQWWEKTMFVVIENAKGVYKPESRIKYVRFWVTQYNTLVECMKDLPPETTIDINKDIKIAKLISLEIGELIAKIADTVNPLIDKAIEEILNHMSIFYKIELPKDLKLVQRNPVTKMYSLSREAEAILLGAFHYETHIIITKRISTGFIVITDGSVYGSTDEDEWEEREHPWDGKRLENAIEELFERGYIHVRNSHAGLYSLTVEGCVAAEGIIKLHSKKF